MSRGLTLVELVIAMGLAVVVALGLSNLVVPLARAQVLAQRAQTAQMEAASALSWADRSIRQASWVSSPPATGEPSPILSGCVNGEPGVGTAPPSRVDPARPVTWFALCSSGGVLYRHEGDGCPPAYYCGSSPQGTFGGGGPGVSATASFRRTSPRSTAVDVAVEVRSKEAVSTLRTSVAFSAAAGGNP